ncbi:MAG: ketopantoate reductase family protein [Steroidobacteraceae bacterium]
MRAQFAILGPGALGSILAAHLARAGHRVIVLARGARAELIEREGLRITGLSELTVPVTVLTDPARLEAAECLIVATKTPGTHAALESLRHVSVDSAFSVQNGVLKNELLAAVFGAERVLGALANTSGEVLEGGEVLFTRNVNLLLGELDGRESERARTLAARIDAAGVRASAVPRILSWEWSKFVAWLPLMSLAVSTRVPTGQYLSDPGSAWVLVRMAREAVRLASACGAQLLPEGAILPLHAILTGSEQEAVESVRAAGAQFAAQSPEHRMSALQDLLAGRPLEVEETFGDAVLKARRAGLEVPLLEAFYHLVAAIDRGRPTRR